MKVVASNISERYLQSYKLTKKIDNGFKVDSIDGEAIYEGDDHKYLVIAACNAYDQETGTISKMCGDLEFEKSIVIKHSEGTFDLQRCMTTKKVQIANELDCVTEKTINIFDYTATETNTIQGDQVRRSYHYNEVLRYESDLTDSNPRKSLSDVLAIVGYIPDRAFLGYFLEHAILEVVPQFATEIDPQYGEVEYYVTTKYAITVTYININSATQITPSWKPTLGGGYHYVLPQNFNEWGSENAPDRGHWYFPTNTFVLYQQSTWELGRPNQYIEKTISNTYSLNEILIDLFSCTGLTLRSDFFNINSDATAPDNKYYQWAATNAQDVKIAQSFDIIRENAQQDSFGISGNIQAKDLISDILFLFNMTLAKDGGVLRLEHKSYFTGKGIDITAKVYEIDPLEMNRDLIDQEAFRYKVNFDNFPHYEAVLKYRTTNIYGKPNEQGKTTEKIVTDVFSAINNEKYNESQYEDLFYLLLTDGTSIIGLNSAMAMPDLILQLHDLERPLKVCEIKGRDGKYYFENYSIGFTTTIKLSSNAVMWEKIQPYMSVVTQEGTFVILESTIDEKDVLELTVKK